MSIPKLSNPFSTGGGGDQFEKSVGAYYLVALLAEDIPRGLRHGITKRVKFQQRYAGVILDDVVVTSENGNAQEFQIDIQVKHDLAFTRTNQVFRRVINDCWQSFIDSKERNFNSERDKLGIAFGTQPPAKVEHLQRALDWARTTTSADDYFIKLETPELASGDMRYYVNDVFRPVLDDVAKYKLTDNEVFQFLRCLVILHFDLEHDGARDTIYVWNRLLDQFDVRDEIEARKLTNHLFRLVVEYSKDAAGFDHRTLRDKLANDFHLRNRISCQQDLDRLRQHSDLVLDRIVTEIGGDVSLPRSKLLNDLWTYIEQVGSGIVVITGEPGTGKSVLMKLLADHLRQENEVIVTEVDRLRGPSLESFLEMLQVKQPLDRLLSATSSGSFRCLFIDQLERVQGDEERRRVLDDFIRVVCRFNEQMLANGGHTDTCWRIVLMCRKEEFLNSVLHTVLNEYIQAHSLREIEVGDLTGEEFRAVLKQFPRLDYLSNYERANFLLKRPFYLNLLTTRQHLVDEANLPEQFTETWFLKFFWEDVVCKGQFHHEREQVLLRIVSNRLVKGTSFTSIADLNSTSLDSLISDRIIKQEEMGIRLAHDLFEDWIGERLIASTGDQLTSLWEQAVDPTSLLRPIELRALYHLEVNNDAETWYDLTSPKNVDKVPPSWRDVAVGAIFKSKRLAELLELAKPLLLSKNSTLMLQVLRIMRTVYSKPNASMRKLLVEIPEWSVRKKEIFLASSRDPIVFLWDPVLRFILNNQDKLPLSVLPELSQICEMWLKTFIAPLRSEVALLCYRYLHQTFDESLDDLAYGEDEEVRVYSNRGTISGQTRHTLTIALLSAADCVPDTVETFVRHELEKEKQGIVGELLFKDVNWIYIGRYLPELLLEAAEQILCWKPLPSEYFEKLLARPGPKSITLHVKDEEEQYREICRYGFRIFFSYNWNPITYNSGPFYLFLRMHQKQGLQLIHKIVNYATDIWRRCQKLDEFQPLTPLPQQLKLKTGAVELWGDERVYCWSRIALQNPPVESALRALEKWLYEEIEKGKEPTKLFNQVLADSTSLSVIGVLVSVSLKYMKECGEALLPVLAEPAFWITDIHRLVPYEQIAGLGIFDFTRHLHMTNL